MRKPKKFPREYKQCIGCGNQVNGDENVGKCELCGSQKWITCVENFY